MKYTREQYMSNEVSHADYYRQWVTPEIKRMVLNRFGLDRLIASRDEYLNDIPLHIWDSLCGANASSGNYRSLVKAGDNSLASGVCVLKQAALMLIEEAREEVQQ